MSNKYSYPNIFSTMKEKHKRLVMDKVIGLNTFNSLTIQAYQKGGNGTFLKTYDKNIADAVHFNTGAIRVLKQEWD
jgi:hypothetical protein